MMLASELRSSAALILTIIVTPRPKQYPSQPSNLSNPVGWYSVSKFADFCGNDTQQGSVAAQGAIFHLHFQFLE